MNLSSAWLNMISGLDSNMSDTILICPKNDEESLQIFKIAQALKIPTLVSEQPHGARLYNEPDLMQRLTEVDPEAKHLVIVEIPGPEMEEKLKEAGYRLTLIDHHRYEDMNRMQPLSSLEQFLQQFSVSDDKLESLGFDPLLVKGVGMVDRGFLWELTKEGVKKEDAKRIRDYYLDLVRELGGMPESIIAEAQQAWDKREEQGAFIVVRSKNKGAHIREALSFIVADHYTTPPQLIILEGDGRVTLQDSELAPKLHQTFGGFTFGKDRCWGFAPTSDKSAPKLEEILEVLR